MGPHSVKKKGFGGDREDFRFCLNSVGSHWKGFGREMIFEMILLTFSYFKNILCEAI